MERHSVRFAAPHLHQTRSRINLKKFNPFGNIQSLANSSHRITKKVKMLLAGLFAVAIVGGAGIHHVYHEHYIQSPESVDLAAKVDNHVYHGSTPAASDITGTSGSSYFGGLFDGALIPNSDVFFSQNNIRGYSLDNPNNTSDEDSDTTDDQLSYSFTKHTLTLQDSGTPEVIQLHQPMVTT